MGDLGCAQDADGNLLSPSKIKWYNDVDDVDPIAVTGPSPSAKPTTLDRFFTSGNPTVMSADKIAGSRRSGRTPRPSKTIVDPDNTETPTFVASSGLKRKVSATTVTQKLSRLRKAVEASDNDAGDTEMEDGGDVYVEPTEKADSGEEDGHAEANYMSTKALGDTDREVSYVFYVPLILKDLAYSLVADPKLKELPISAQSSLRIPTI